MKTLAWLTAALMLTAACGGTSAGTGMAGGPDAGGHDTSAPDITADVVTADDTADSGTPDDLVVPDTAVTDVPAPPDVAVLDAPDVAAPIDTGTPDVPVATDVPVTPDVPVTTDVPVAPDTGGCGVCPHGFTCGAGGLCRSATGIPHFGQVHLVVMENTSVGSLQGSSSAPYVNTLYHSAAVAGRYQSVVHPSLPNYIALTSGSDQGISCDCQPSGAGACNFFTCNIILSSCACNQNVAHLGDQLETAMLPWRSYGQGMGSPCNTASSGSYAVKHLPFLYYDNVRTNHDRCTAHVRDYADFTADRGHYAFSMISPDLCHDMHDSCTPTNDRIRQGDDWLRTQVPLITSAPGFSTDGVLFIVWDEGDLSLSDTVTLLVISPLARGGTTSTHAYTHYSLLATIEDGLGLARLGHAAGTTPLADLFH